MFKGEEKMKKTTEETLNRALDCLVRARHPDFPYLAVNQLIIELSKLLPEQKVKKKE